jgi:ketosteroid isomerase-like protein
VIDLCIIKPDICQLLTINHSLNSNITDMKKNAGILSTFMLTALLVLLMSSCSQKPVDVTGEIAKANNEIMAAYEKGDINSLKDFYTSDAKLLPENTGAVEGPDAIAGFFGVTMNMGIKKVKFEAVTATSYGNIAIEEGKYTLFAPGDHIADQGKYIVTWKKEDGKWRVYRDIFNTNNSAPVKRASVNDTVMIVINNIKADKVSQFEDYVKNYLGPASTELNSQVKQTVRTQKATGPNKDGSFTYIFFMDPVNSNFDYDMGVPLAVKYGEEKAAAYGKMYRECVMEGYPKVIVATETNW